jgi:hypothetical protein
MASVVELGCGFGNNLAGLSAPYRIGIDIWKPYLERDLSHGARMLYGDMLDLSLLPELKHPTVALLIDVIEHIEKEAALAWLDRLKLHFDRILVNTPLGFHVQEHDVYELGGDEYQKHRSGWQPEDLGGFVVEIDPDYHSAWAEKGGAAAIFAIWNKP